MARSASKSFFVLETRDPWESDPRYQYVFQDCFKTRQEAEAAPIPNGEGRTVSEVTFDGTFDPVEDLKNYGERERCVRCEKDASLIPVCARRTRIQIREWFEQHGHEL